MKRAVMVLEIILMCALSYAGIFINEIRYSVPNTNSTEWIELITNETTNLTGWKFYEDETNHVLTLANGEEIVSEYVVIAKDASLFLSEYPNFNGTLFDSSWGSLSNTGEYIAVKNKDLEIVDEVNYSSEWGGKLNTLEKVDSFIPLNEKENWGNSMIEKGTPGAKNSLFGSCDWQISIISDKSVYEILNKSVEVKWKIRVYERRNMGEINFSYWIDDTSGNDVKAKVDKTANSSSDFGYYQKSFSDAGGYVLIANMTGIQCKDIELDNNYAALPIIIKGNEMEKSKNSSLNIVEVQEGAKFGESIDVKMKLYRGDTTKYAAYVYVEDVKGADISEKTTLYLDSRFSNYSMTVPVRLKSNCDEKYKNGQYFIVIEGLDKKITKEIAVTGTNTDDCKTVDSEEEKSVTRGKLTYEITEVPATIYLNKSFSVVVSLENTYKDNVEADIWSYVYRGNKKYSDELVNLKQVTVKNGDSKETELKITVPEGEEGDYKLKVKVQKEGRKTSDDKTINIHLSVPEKKEENKEEVKNAAVEVEKYAEEQRSGSGLKDKVVYESESFFIKRVIPALIFLLFCLAVIFSLVLLKEN